MLLALMEPEISRGETVMKEKNEFRREGGFYQKFHWH